MTAKDIKNYKVDDRNYVFVNTTKNTRNGFKHESELQLYGLLLAKGVCHYQNRTWEAFTYQDVMLDSLDKALDKWWNLNVDKYKEENGVKRLTKKHREKVENKYNEVDTVKDLQEIKSRVKEGIK